MGQKDESTVVQIKVYNTSGGQFQLKSTYYGHTADTRAVALLENGMAVSAGGDQNSIHFWSPVHLEGELVAMIRGLGRTVRAVGINEQEQIGFGNHADMLLEDGRIAFQRIFDLRSLTLKPLTLSESIAANFQRSQTSLGEQKLEFGRRGDSWNLFLDPAFLALIQGNWYHPSTFGFIKNGTVITGADDGRVRVVAMEREGQVEPTDRTLVGHTSRVLDHAASNKWLVTCGKDQVIRLWYMEDVEQDVTTTLEPALNLFVGMDDEWVVWSKSGYYTASKNGDRYLGYHINRGTDKEALFFSSDRFHTVFLRPDIINAILIHGSEERAAERDPRISIRSINVAEILPPIIELAKDGVNTYESENNKEGFVTFTLTVESQGRPITRLCLLRNGRLVHLEKSVPSSGKITIPSIPLLPGNNRFKIFAENEDALGHVIKSNPIEYTIHGKGRYEDEPILEKGILYILAIGVSTGLHLSSRTSGNKTGPFELDFPHLDATAILDAFTNENKAFEAVEKTLLVNQQATKENILTVLNETCQKIKQKVEDRVVNGETPKRDVLLVYLSGHGVYRIINQQLYFWNYDFDPEEPSKTGLAFLDLGEKITSLPAEVILLTDACHSGMAGSDVVQGLDPDQGDIDPNDLAKRIYAINESDIYILNAARRSESALEGASARHGYFTRAILDTLSESIDPGVTMIGLIDQVQWRIQRYTTAQNPVCRVYGDLLPLTVYKK